MNGRKGVYAILDKIAGEYTGGMMALQVHRAEAAAVRVFIDIAQTEHSMIRKNPGDFELVRLGWLDEETGYLMDEYQSVLTGSAWAASLTPLQGAPE